MKHKHYMPRGMAERLAQCIYESKLSQGQIASIVGVNRKTINAYCNNVQCPDALILLRMCDVLNVSADYLLKGV